MPAGARRVALLAIVGTLALASAGAAQAAASIGFQDQSYAPLGGSPSGTKPESKLWFNNGWWASMFNPTAGAHHIYKLNTATGVWRDTGVAIDDRDGTRADALWDAATNKLYVSSHVTTSNGVAATAANSGRLYRFTYTPATDSYKLDAGFPVTINAATSETLVIDEDSTGTLWATWTQGSRVFVNHSVGGNDATWGTPFIVPGAGTTLTSDDISSLIQFGGNKIGVMWSNQVDHRVYFSVHVDGTGDGAASWATEVVPTGATSDDHINLKTDGSGRIYAAVKTSETTKTRPLIMLLVRSATGTWTATTYGTVANSQTRPIVLLDEQHNLIHMFATCPQPPNTSGQSGGDICEKTAPMTNPSFAAGIGTPVISEAGSPDMNDATSTKQNVNSTTGIVVMGNNATSKTYWHMQESLGTPTATLAAGFTATPVSGTAPLAVQFTDTSTGSPTSFTWSFGDGTTATAGSPAHTYMAPGTYTVSETVKDAAGNTDTATKTGLITVTAPGGGGTTMVLQPGADAQVKSTSPNTNYGTLDSFRVRQGTTPTDVFYDSYLTFTLPGPVSDARLRLFTTDASPDGGSVFAVAQAFDEGTLTWNNRPPLAAPPIASIGATAPAGSFSEVDLGAFAGGVLRIGLASNSSNSAIYSSRESVNPPQLVVTTG
jgi:PKD domain-containing protein